MLHCVPTYVSKLKSEKCKTIQVRKWPEGDIDILRGCFDCTNWEILYDDECSLKYNVDVCTCYIKFCTDMVIPTKNVIIYPNNKPWLTREVKLVINKKKHSLSSDRADIKVIQKELDVTIRNAKNCYKNKVEDLFKTNKTKDAWTGLKYLSGFKSKCCLPEPDDINVYVNELNQFYARFDDKDFGKECIDILNIVNETICDRIVLTDDDVMKALGTAKPVVQIKCVFSLFADYIKCH
jgi:hypothetical protein